MAVVVKTTETGFRMRVGMFEARVNYEAKRLRVGRLMPDGRMLWFKNVKLDTNMSEQDLLKSVRAELVRKEKKRKRFIDEYGRG